MSRRSVFGVSCAEVWPRWWSGRSGQLAVTACEGPAGDWKIAIGHARDPRVSLFHAAGPDLAAAEAALEDVARRARDLGDELLAHVRTLRLEVHA